MRASQIALSAIVALDVTSAVAQSSPPATLKEQLDAIWTRRSESEPFAARKVSHLRT
jgi:hypothetical protein